jgi:hypothetical protein
VSGESTREGLLSGKGHRGQPHDRTGAGWGSAPPPLSPFPVAWAVRMSCIARSSLAAGTLTSLSSLPCGWLSYMPFIIKATSLALAQYPILNSSLQINEASGAPHHCTPGTLASYCMRR